MRRHTLPLLLILILAAALRLLYVTTPYLDGHRWRQVDTAAIARNFYEGSLNPLTPRVDWGGADGRVETEFPLVPLLAAVLARGFGFRPAIGRLPVILFSLGLIAAIYWLVLLLDGRIGAARAAAFFVAIAPSAVFFGRTLMPDVPMLCFSVLALAGFAEYAYTGSRRALWIGSASFGLACLVKIPAIVIALPIAAVLLEQRGLRVFRDARVWIAVAVPVAATVLWYWHAMILFRRTGLTFGILVHPAKTYPAWISPGPWPSVFSKWSTPALLSDWEFYERLFARFYYLHLTPAVLVLAAVGAFVWRGKGWRVQAAWLAAMVLFVLVAGHGHRAHDYYQLPFVAIAALYFGTVAWPVFDGVWLRSHLPSAAARTGLILLVGALGLASFYYSGVMRTHFRSGRLDTRTLAAGQVVDAATDDGSLAVVVDDYGITSPMLFYFSRLKGWSFDVGDLSAPLVDRLRRSGARYFATTRWSSVEAQKPEVVEYLRRYQEIPLENAPRGVRVFRLR